MLLIPVHDDKFVAVFLQVERVEVIDLKQTFFHETLSFL